MSSVDFSEYNTTFSENLRSLMDSRGLSGAALAIECGTPNPSINRYLSASRVPKIDNIIILAKFFNVSIDWLLGLSDEKYESWTPEIRDLVRRYSIASPHDRQIVDTALSKYKEE